MKALRPLLDYLAPLGVLPVPAEVPPDPVEELLGRYRGYLLVERGLTRRDGARLRGLRAAVRRDPGARRCAGSGRDRPRPMSPGSCWPACPGRAVGSAKLTVTRAAVAAGVLAPDGRDRQRRWRRRCRRWRAGGWAGLPRALEPEQLRRLLASCDRRTPHRAAGLRDPDAAGPAGAARRRGRRLRLDDIDWRAGEIVDRAARATAPSGCRCRPMSARRSSATCGDGRPATALDRGVFVRVQRPAPGADQRRGHAGRVRRGRARRAGPRSTRTGCGTPPPPRCCAPARRCRRSARCCATAGADHGDLRQGRPRRAARCSRGRGRRSAVMTALRERARRLPGDAPRAGLQARARREAAGPVRRLPRRARRRRRSRSSWRWRGRRCPPAPAPNWWAPPAVGRARLRRATCTRSTRRTRCRRRTCCRSGRGAPCPTCTPTTRSPR